MGLLDFNMNLDPKTQGLLGLGQGLLQSSGWSPTPISTGQAMGQGLKSGLGAYTQAQGRLDKKNAKGKIETKIIPMGVDADGKPIKQAAFIQNGQVIGFAGPETPTTPGVNINMPAARPTLPSGFDWVDRNDPGKGMKVIPDSPAARTLKKKAESKAAESKQAKTQATRMIGHIDRARAQAKGAFVTGLPGSILSGLPGTGAHDLAQTIQTIKANTTFDKLLAVKKAGGSLGAINEAELMMLGSAVSNLEQSQSEEQFSHNLDIVDELYAKIISDAPEQEMSRIEYLRAKQRGEVK